MLFKTIKVSFLFILFSTFTQFTIAESVASYPEGWEEWPVVKETMTLPVDTILPPDTSLFIQESVKAYDWINNGLGSPMTIRVHPDKLEEYAQHGPYSDGPTVVAVSEVQGIIWTTEHIAGIAIYGTYNRNGEDITDMHPTLDPDYCHGCHNKYKDICINGTCAEPVMEIFGQ